MRQQHRFHLFAAALLATVLYSGSALALATPASPFLASGDIAAEPTTPAPEDPKKPLPPPPPPPV